MSIARSRLAVTALLFALALATPAPGTAAERTGPTLAAVSSTEARSFWSPTLGRLMPYFVYLPPGYAGGGDERYPVLYMLHGMGGSNSEWRGYGLFGAADALIRAHEIRPFV